MKVHFRFFLALFFLLSFVCFSIKVTAQPGSLDTTFNFGFPHSYFTKPDNPNPGAGANNRVRFETVQPDGKILVSGEFTTYNGTLRGRIARLNEDGSLDGNFNPGTGANNDISTIAIQADGKILIGGDFTTYNNTSRSRLARLNTDGSLDATFDPGTGANGSVTSFTILSDGKILVGGYFTNYNGTYLTCMIRLNPDGSLDSTFNHGTQVQGGINTHLTQPDGKIIIAGGFTRYHDIARNNIARLNADGSLDVTFNPGTGADNTITSIALQPDGKIIVGGNFTYYNGTSRNRIARLNTNGSLDYNFNPGSGVNYWIKSILLQPDGKIIIAGEFSVFNGVLRKCIARLHTGGSLDATFNPGTGVTSTFPVEGFHLALLPDGKILLGGEFKMYNGTGMNRLALLNSDGSLDVTFNPVIGANEWINCIINQPDGKILIGGYFTHFNGIPRNRIARLNEDGSLDATFNPGTGANNSVNSIVLQPDGKIIVGGHFTSFNGTSKNSIVRLNKDGSLDPTFNSGTGANNGINSIVLQPDGKILIGGSFTNVNGTGKNHIARLNGDGSLDATFNTGNGANRAVYTVSLQPDGKIIIGGDFTLYDGVERNRVARLNVNGSLDATFNPGKGATFTVRSMALQSNGKILITGGFWNYNGTPRSSIVRVNSDGTLDPTFDPGTGAKYGINTIALQSDGKILIGGDFESYNETQINRIARLNENGSLDTTFNPGAGVSSMVYSISVQPDDKILVGGFFFRYNNISRVYIARIKGNCTNNSTSTAPICKGGTKTLTGISGGTWSIVSGGGSITGTTYTHSGNSKSVTVRNNDGQCYGDVTFPIIPDAFLPSIEGLASLTQCMGNELVVKPQLNGVATNFIWKKDGQELVGKTDSILSVGDLNLNDAGFYQVQVTFICSVVLSKGFDVRVIDSLYCGKISGKVQAKNTCAGPALFSVPNVPVMITGSQSKRYTITNDSGEYLFHVSPGNYTVEYLNKRDACNSLTNVNIASLGSSISNIHFNDSLPTCPTLALSIATGLFRQGRPSTVALHYSNKSGFTGQNVKVRLKISELFEITNTTHPIASTSPDGELEFDLGDLGAYQSGQIRLDGTVSMSASALIQSSLCFDGEIEASNLCVPAIHPNYSGASLATDAQCMQNGMVQLRLHDAGTAAMPDSSEYRVFVDSLLVLKGKTRLSIADTHIVQVPAEGRTVRLEADQVAFHPLNKKVNVTVHGCGAAEGMVLRNNTNMFALLPMKPTEATACRAVTGSYDPNDKRAVPEGVTVNNYLPTGGNKLDFTIRFQNTGNDTAFLVRITDTLSNKLDLSTFAPGASSHDYTYEIMGEENPVIQWIFDDIYLPDSTTDSDGSNGFVSFSIMNYDTLPEFSTIENYADIYFDFNPPIRTDTVVRIVHDYVEIGQMSDLGLADISISLISQVGTNIVALYPNPASSQFTIATGYEEEKHLEVTDLTGRMIATRHFSSGRETFSTDQMAKGVYILRLVQGSEVSTHKLVIE